MKDERCRWALISPRACVHGLLQRPQASKRTVAAVYDRREVKLCKASFLRRTMLSKVKSVTVHPRNDRHDSTKASQCPTLVAAIIYRHIALKFVENVRLRNQRRSVFIASKIKVLKFQTAEAAIRVQIYQTPSSKVRGSSFKCTLLTTPRKACLPYIYTWMLGAFHLQSD